MPPPSGAPRLRASSPGERSAPRRAASTTPVAPRRLASVPRRAAKHHPSRLVDWRARLDATLVDRPGWRGVLVSPRRAVETLTDAWEACECGPRPRSSDRAGAAFATVSRPGPPLGEIIHPRPGECHPAFRSAEALSTAARLGIPRQAPRQGVLVAAQPCRCARRPVAARHCAAADVRRPARLGAPPLRPGWVRAERPAPRPAPGGPGARGCGPARHVGTASGRRGSPTRA